MKFHFTSERLGFRSWKASDLEFLNRLNSDAEVMKYFPSTLSQVDNSSFIHRMQRMFKDKGYCYWPVEELQSQSLIGFIGLSFQDYTAHFNPSIDIGWRINTNFQGKGYATEGAKKVLDYAKNELRLIKVVSVAPIFNKPSIRIMEKIGMLKEYNFNHPKLSEHIELRECSLYSIIL